MWQSRMCDCKLCVKTVISVNLCCYVVHVQIACSANHCLALVRDLNQVYSWGGGDGGRLGHGDSSDRYRTGTMQSYLMDVQE